MEPNNSDLKVRDKDADAAVVTPIGSLEKSSEMFGDNFGKFEESISFDSDDSDFEAKYTCELCKKNFSGLKPLRQHERSKGHLKNLSRTKLKKALDDELSVEDASESFFEDKVYAECKDCKKEFTGLEPYQQHVMSRGHKKKIALKKLKDRAKEDGKINLEKLKQLIEQEGQPNRLRGAAHDSDEDDIEANDLKCSDCEKEFSGLESFYDHMKSKTHKKILKQKELISKLITGTTSGNTSSIEVNEEDIICKLCHLSFTGPENVTAHLKSRGHAKMQEKRQWKKMQKEKESFERNQRRVPDLKDNIESVNETVHLPLEQKDDLQESREKTLSCYSRYKQYKEIMKNAQFNQNE